MKIEFHPQAEDEFVEEAAYYERKVPALGASFVAELESAKALLEAHPEIGTETNPPFQHLPMRKFLHSLIYVIEVNRVWIVAVAHQKRRPRYWLERMER